MKEIWKDVPGHEGAYVVSNLGNVVRLAYVNRKGARIPERTIKLKTNNRGYWQVRLYRDGECENWLLHRLVAFAFIPNPERLPQVNHKDEDKNNNMAVNLEWCTNIYNRHYGTGLERSISNHDYDEIARKNRKYVAQIGKNNQVIAVWHGLIAAAEAVGGSKDAIRNSIKRGHKSCGYYWGYV